MIHYIKEIVGSKFLEPDQWRAKQDREDQEFRDRLSKLPKAKALAICRQFEADCDLAATSGGRIATEWLRSNT